jgi:hypothetical protein
MIYLITFVVTMLLLGVFADLVSDAMGDLRMLLHNARQIPRKVCGLYIPWRCKIAYRAIVRRFNGATVAPYDCPSQGEKEEIDMTRIETLIATALNGSNLSTIVDNAVAQVVANEVSRALQDLTSEAQEVKSTPIVAVKSPSKPAKAQEVKSTPVTSPKAEPSYEVNLDTDGRIASVLTPLGLIPWNGRTPATQSPLTGSYAMITSVSSGNVYPGIIMGQTVKGSSDALIVRPLSPKTLKPVRACVPVAPSNVEVKEYPSTCQSNLPAPKVAKKRGAAPKVVTPASSVAAPTVNVKNAAHVERIKKGEPIVIRLADGSFETTESGAVKRFNPAHTNGYSACIGVHKLVRGTGATVHFASDLAL